MPKVSLHSCSRYTGIDFAYLCCRFHDHATLYPHNHLVDSLSNIIWHWNEYLSKLAKINFDVSCHMTISRVLIMDCNLHLPTIFIRFTIDTIPCVIKPCDSGYTSVSHTFFNVSLHCRLLICDSKRFLYEEKAPWMQKTTRGKKKREWGKVVDFSVCHTKVKVHRTHFKRVKKLTQYGENVQVDRYETLSLACEWPSSSVLNCKVEGQAINTAVGQVS